MEKIFLERSNKYPKDYSWITDKVLQDYLRDLSITNENEVMKECRLNTLKMKRAGLISSPLTQQLFKVLLPAIGAKKCLEIGIFTGYGTLSYALSIPEDGKVICAEFNEEYAKNAREYFEKAGVSNKVEVKVGKANDILDELLKKNGEEGSFDFVFIDADKKNQIDYYEKSYKLIRKNGLIAIDNTLWHGAVCYDPEKCLSDNDPQRKKFKIQETSFIKKLNEHISKDKRVESIILGLSDGLTIVRKK